ncbi:MAG: ATPase [Rhodospirillaceae bacterium]|nr:MAG: ATPase [Rhodospirillaceae bacterium]
MNKPSAAKRLIYGNFTIERVYPQAPARVFAAWSNPEVKARWFIGPPPWKLVERAHDFRIGGEELCHGRFSEAGTVTHGCGAALHGGDTIFRARYSDIQPDARIVFTYDMSWNGAHRSTSIVGVEILAEGKGTRLIFTEHVVFLDGEDGTESRRTGSAAHLESLAAAL